MVVRLNENDRWIGVLEMAKESCENLGFRTLHINLGQAERRFLRK